MSCKKVSKGLLLNLITIFSILLDYATVRGGNWTENLCNLPPVSGYCAVLREPIIRYFFSSDRLDCTEFPYSGCLGNSNNFNTYDDCMEACGGELDRILKSIKEAQDKGSCWYKNEIYRNGEAIAKAIVETKCKSECRCEYGKISCSPVNCPISRSSSECHPLPQKTCCANYYCLNEPKPDNLMMCKSENASYFFGDSIKFKDYPCLRCSCTPDFQGPTLTSKACSMERCQVVVKFLDYILKGCKPFIKNKGCCPLEYTC